MSAKAKKLFQQIQRIGAIFVSLEKGFVFQHGAIKLYSSEIHLMQTVEYSPDINASEIAKLLGVTKGAVSQTITRLENKGILKRKSGPLYSNELRILLTPFGKDALASLLTKNNTKWRDLTMYFENLTEEEDRTIARFLVKLEDFLKSLS